MGGYLHGTRLLNLEEMAEIWWVSPHICSWVRQKKLIPTRICTRLLFALPECERFLRSMEQCKVTPASVTRAQQENEGYLASHVLHNYSTRGQLKSNRNKEIREAQWHAVVCSSERLRVHPVLQELRLSGLLDTDLSNPLLAEPILVTTNGIVISGFAAILSRRSCFRLGPIGIGRNSERQFAAPSVRHCLLCRTPAFGQKYTLPRTRKNLFTTPAKVLPARVAAIAPRLNGSASAGQLCRMCRTKKSHSPYPHSMAARTARKVSS
jgi:hypothetical protein